MGVLQTLEDELMNRGFCKVELDKEAREKALLSADQRDEVKDYADMTIEKMIVIRSAAI